MQAIVKGRLVDAKKDSFDGRPFGMVTVYDFEARREIYISCPVEAVENYIRKLENGSDVEVVADMRYDYKNAKWKFRLAVAA